MRRVHLGVLLFSLFFAWHAKAVLYRVGALVPQNNAQMLSAVRFAFQKLNSSSSLPAGFGFELLVETVPSDDQYAVVSATTRLIQSNVLAIVGPSTSTLARLVGKVAESAQVPVFSPDATDPELASFPFVLRVAPSDAYQGQAVASLLKAYNWKSCALIHSDDFYGRNGGRSFLASAKASGITTITVEVSAASPNTTELADQLKSLYQKDVNVFVLNVVSPIHETVLRLAKDASLFGDRVWILTDGTASYLNTGTDVPSDLRPLMPGVWGLRPRLQNPDLTDFYVEWRTLNATLFPGAGPGAKISIYSAYAYDATTLIGRTLTDLYRSGNYTPASSGTNSPGYVVGGGDSTANLGAQGAMGRLLTQTLRYASYYGPFGWVRLDAGGSGSGAPLYEVVNWHPTNNFSVVAQWAGGSGAGSDNLLFTGQLVTWPNGASKAPDAVSRSRPLKILVADNPPFNGWKGNGSANTDFSGFTVDVFKMAADSTGQQYQFIPWPGSYNGALYLVRDGIYDGACGDFGITSARTKFVDFAQPYVSNGFVLITRQGAPADPSWRFVSPFTWRVWLALFGLIAWGAVVLLVVEYGTEEEKALFPSSKPLHENLVYALHYNFSLLFNSQEADLVRTMLGKFYLTLLNFGVLILVASYTANLATALTIVKFVQPIDSIDTAIARNVKIGFYDGPVGYQVLLDAGVSPSNIVRGLSSNDDYENALKSGAVDAVMEGSVYAQLFVNQKCGFQVVGREFASSRWGFAFTPGSKFTQLMSAGIVAVSDSGKIDKSLANMLAAVPNNCPATTSSSSGGSTASALSIQSFRGLFIIVYVAGAILIAVRLLLDWVRPTWFRGSGLGTDYEKED